MYPILTVSSFIYFYENFHRNTCFISKLTIRRCIAFEGYSKSISAIGRCKEHYNGCNVSPNVTEKKTKCEIYSDSTNKPDKNK